MKYIIGGEMMNCKTTALKVLGVALPVAVIAGQASAAYTAVYTVSDLSPSIIDIVAGITVGVAGQSITIGQATGLTIAISLLIGLVILVLHGVKSIRQKGKMAGE